MRATQHLLNTIRSSALLGVLGLMLMTISVGAYAATGTRASAFEYDSISGLLTKEIIEPDDPNLCLVTTYTYDSFGNKTGATTRNCNGSAGANAPTNTEAAAPTTATPAGADAIIVARTSTTTYDAQGRFAISSTNALNQTETKTYNPNFGTVASLTGPNNLTTNWTYDSFGRPLTESRADGTSSSTAYALCDASCLANGKYTITKSQPGAPTTVTTYDMHNRVIQTAAPDKDGIQIYTNTEYDKLGRTSRTSRPFKAGAAIAWTTISYDTIGRPVSTTSPDNSVNSTTYNGYTTVTTNAKSQTTTEIKNSQGQLVTVTDTQSKSLTYQYDTFGNLTKTTDALGNITTITYDKRGRKVGMDDPDQGVWSYSYDVLGQLKKQTDAKLQVVTFTYDKLGRMTNRTEPDLISNWTYDVCDSTLNPAGKCIGKPVKETSDNNYARTYLYDTYGRATAELDNVDTGYGVTKSFDSFGRVANLVYPNGFQITNVYSSNGYLIEIRKTSDNSLYWQATGATDTEGRIAQYKYGNNITTNMTYDTMGRTQTIKANGLGGVDQTLGNTPLTAAGSVTNQSFVYDTLGNLTQRYDGVTGLNESFGYDTLNRLESTSAQVGTTGPLTQTTLTYNAIGNIITKSDVGTYTYASLKANGSARPHAVSSIMMNDGVTNYGTYTYDANGNMLTGLDSSNKGRTITWTSWNMAASVVGNKPATATAGLPASTPINTTSSTFSVVYNSAHERVKEILPDGTIVYNVSPRVDTGINVEKRVKPDGTIQYVNSLYAGSMPFGTVTVTTPPNNGAVTTATNYFHTDHLGSIIAISDQAGNITQRRSYDAWGKKRNLNGTAFANAFVTPNERHGFTGHEEWDEVGLINMNGRLYDPAIGRFMSADPTIQYPDDMQNYNRYSYVNNNPLSMVDRSGYGFFKSISKAFKKLFKGIKHLLRNKVVRLVASIAAAWYIGIGPEGYGIFGAGGAAGSVSMTASAFTVGALNGAAAGAAAGFIASGGNIKVALTGAITGGIAGGVGSQFPGSSYGDFRSAVQKMAADAFVGGVNAKVQGQSFISGFKSGFTFSALNYITYSAGAFERQSSSGSGVGPDQTRYGCNGTDGQNGCIAGERINKDELIKAIGDYNKVNGTTYTLSTMMSSENSGYWEILSHFSNSKGGPFGGIQVGIGTLFGHKYDTNGFLNYVVEGFGGFHDFLNHGLFYNSDGTSHRFAFGGILGEAASGLNVGLAMPVAIPAMVPYSARSAIINGLKN